MKLVIYSSIGLLAAAAAHAKVLEIQVGNPTAPTMPEKLSFTPDVQLVDPGDTVRFLFNGNHTVTQQATFGACAMGTPEEGGTPFDSDVKVKGDTFELPASALVPGATINYYCRINKGAHCRDPNNMQGAIFVSSAGPAPSGAAKKAAPEEEAEPADNLDGTAGTAPTTTTAPATDAAPTATGPGAKITVEVGKDGTNAYSPSEINAAPGDTVVFQWGGGAKSHNVVPSDQPKTCTRSANIETDAALKALDSGAPQSSGTKEFVVPATAAPGDTMNFYCSVGTHCDADKMYGTITVVAPGGATTPATAPATDGTPAAPATGGTPDVAPADDLEVTEPAPADGTAAESRAPPGTVRSDATSVSSAGMAVFATAAAAALMLA